MPNMTNTMQNGRQTWPNVANHAKCKVTMPKCSKYHAKRQVLVPNCCKYKANGTGKENQKKIRQKKIPKAILHPYFFFEFSTLMFWLNLSQYHS